MTLQRAEPFNFKYFWYELSHKFLNGAIADSGLFYIFFTAVGVGLASYLIPITNGSEISPETLGIYVIGFLVSAGLDALMELMKVTDSGNHNRYGRAIAKWILVLTTLLLLWAWYLSLHVPAESAVVANAAATQSEAVGTGTHANSAHQISAHSPFKIWRTGATEFLFIILLLGLAMSLILAGDGPEQPAFGSLNRDPNDIADKT